MTGKGRIRPETFFFAASLPLCFLFIFILPLFEAPDETVHFLRIYGITKSVWVLPEKSVNLSAGDLEPVRNAAVYHPLSYLFCAAGMYAAEFFTGNPFLLAFAGRMAGAAGSTALIGTAVRKIPYGKWELVMISLLPMSLQQRTALTADSLTYSAVVLLLAEVLSLREQGECDLKKRNGNIPRKKAENLCREKTDKRKEKWMPGLVLLLLLVSCSKIVYFPAVGTVLLIPNDCFLSKRRARIFKTAGLALALAVSLSWLKIASGYLAYTRGGGSAAEKIRYVLKDPPGYAALIFRTVQKYFPSWMTSMTVSPLGDGDFFMPLPLIALVLAVISAGFLYDLYQAVKAQAISSVRKPFTTAFPLLSRVKAVPSVRKPSSGNAAGSGRLVLFSCVVFTVLLIFSALYLQWTKGSPGSIRFIEGIQGRYFLPVLPVLSAALTLRKEKDPDAPAKDPPGGCLNGRSLKDPGTPEEDPPGVCPNGRSLKGPGAPAKEAEREDPAFQNGNISNRKEKDILPVLSCILVILDFAVLATLAFQIG